MKLRAWRAILLTATPVLQPVVMSGDDLKSVIQQTLIADWVEPIPIPGTGLEMWWDAGGSIGLSPILNPSAMWLLQQMGHSAFSLPVIFNDVLFLATSPGGFSVSVPPELDHHIHNAIREGSSAA